MIGLRGIRPDIAELALPHIAKGVMLRKLIWMDIPQRINLTKGNAGTIATIHRDELLDLGRRLILPCRECLEVHVNTITVVVNGQNLFLQTTLLEVPGPADGLVIIA